MTTLLLVEDDPAIAQPLCRALAQHGFDVQHTDSGTTAVERARGGGTSLVLLDLTLPDVDGLDVCRRIRTDDPAIPIVMLTARAEEVDLVVGFDAGADDYITKPFSLAELVARVKARLRLSSPTATTVVQDVRLDREAHRAWRNDDEVELTPKEFELLSLLIGEAGRTVPRMRIMREVWDENWFGPTRTLDMHVSALRRKLDDDPLQPRYITTVRGVGFRFESGT